MTSYLQNSLLHWWHLALLTTSKIGLPLQECQTYKSTYKLTELDSTSLQDRWNRVAVNIRGKSTKEPDFSDLMKFFRNRSRKPSSSTAGQIMWRKGTRWGLLWTSMPTYFQWSRTKNTIVYSSIASKQRIMLDHRASKGCHILGIWTRHCLCRKLWHLGWWVQETGRSPPHCKR